MLKNKKVIIFDLDGTLIDYIGIWNDIDEKLIKTIGDGTIDNIDIGIQRDSKLKEFSKFDDAYLEYCGFLKEKYNSNLPKQEIKKLRYEIANIYLKEKGFILVIASTTNDHTVEIYKNSNKNIIQKGNLEDIFTLIYSKGAVKELKPNPEIHNKVIKQLNVKKEDCIIIEDSLIGVEAANNAGIESIVIYDKYSDGNRKQINQLSQYQIKDFREFLEFHVLYLKY